MYFCPSICGIFELPNLILPLPALYLRHCEVRSNLTLPPLLIMLPSLPPWYRHCDEQSNLNRCATTKPFTVIATSFIVIARNEAIPPCFRHCPSITVIDPVFVIARYEAISNLTRWDCFANKVYTLHSAFHFARNDDTLMIARNP